MAASGVSHYVNNIHVRNSIGNGTSSPKMDRLSPFNSNVKSSVKPRASSHTRKSGSGTMGSPKDDGGVPGRVRVAVRLRPRNVEEMAADADFADCVEPQPELKRLKLRKNNWDADTYEFDAVLTEFASQKRVYEVVAKPVVESVLDGFNGTIMAYGQTGTGKTYTLGRLGKEDTANRGIMVRAMEDILATTSPESDTVSVSYLQLYMETIQDLLNPKNDNISIVEDHKNGEVSLPGATVVEIRDQRSFLDLLQLGETNRFAANTRLNTESSRSHALLMVLVKRSVRGKDFILSCDNGGSSPLIKHSRAPIVRKGKLVVVDLAGSERLHKSGSEGHALEEAKSINLSLSALGKCINALAENSSHIPVRDSKLTRLLRDSFGGTARTSLVITIGPSPRHRGETASTVMFGQRAMKVENMLKLKEEFDYKSLSRKLDIQLESLIAEHERQHKAFEDEIEKIATDAKNQIAEAERNLAVALEEEKSRYQRDYEESIKKMEEKYAMKYQKHTNVKQMCNREEEVSETKNLLQKEISERKAAQEEANNLRAQLAQSKCSEASANSEVRKLLKMLEDEGCAKTELEGEIAMLQTKMMRLSTDAHESSRQLENGRIKSCGNCENGRIESGGNCENGDTSSDTLMSHLRSPHPEESANSENASVAKLFEQVGLKKILSLLQADDADVRIHAVKVVANLAAEESNQEKIVEAGGLASLLMLLRDTKDETIHRVAAGAIANLAMNETNQELIMNQGGIRLLSTISSKAEDPQSLRMIAGAIANLCGNDKLQTRLRREGGIRALLGMVRCKHTDVLAQVARGIANFAKCESRASSQGIKTGKSLLIDDGALPWIVQNANTDAASIRRHIELALCHLAQHESNARDMINGGAIWELVRISRECTREDIRTLAYKTLTCCPSFKAELRRLRIDC